MASREYERPTAEVIRLSERDGHDVITASQWTGYYPGGGDIYDGDGGITVPIG